GSSKSSSGNSPKDSLAASLEIIPPTEPKTLPVIGEVIDVMIGVLLSTVKLTGVNAKTRYCTNKNTRMNITKIVFVGELS
ncbi:MAG: hypothetical protein KAI18_02155, partial [Candidatus Aenigmarchaeota archaeon]|nr:hypothetical protein [Candidatus Aenigmarchaeota archaeon]